jgi:hypothetical protein
MYVYSSELAKSSYGNQFFGHLPINDRHFDYKQKFPRNKNKNKNIDPSPSLIKGPHANNPFTAALAFLAAL